ncbi:hypothetical protein [uncultured Shewanella sp.]|uniref:hypothetical protein n=1 Tax=uncultured Shewanella sp. TaxID=173975 RepID=UPI00262712D7|nr:hypothetical protein [uncultured Shewanella sp.]
MEKENMGRMIIREVIFVAICFGMVGAAFSTSQKNLIGNDGELKEHIHSSISVEKPVDDNVIQEASSKQ